MKFNEYANIYHKCTGNTMSREDYDRRMPIILNEINKATEIANNLRKIATDVINCMDSYVRTGIFKHGIRKRDLKITIEVLHSIKEKNILSENDREIFNFLIEYIKLYIDKKL